MQGNDHSVVRAVLGGDKDAYGALVRAHSGAVFRVAFRIMGNEADAEEIVQEAFLRGYQRLENFQQRSGFGTWIYRIAVNCALNRLGQPGIEAEYRHGEESNPQEKSVQVASREADPERSLLSREIGAVREMAMQRLTPTEKTAFVLRHLEDRSMSEIAEVLGIAPNAARQAVFRAVQKLRRELAPLRGNA
ncbi:MAG TPA: RNA polymerase sigma factor [Acidobacteriaceae bacterium]|jgi:RNA polymerase sigma-70 factor (ECF subfamily)|nr:RNA polymerase sigma factor [Acidobacteriaceae bacterium]